MQTRFNKMTRLKFTLCLVVLFFGKIAIHLKQASAFHQDSGLISATVGDTVTLQCFLKIGQSSENLIWYKQTPGGKPQLVSNFYNFDQRGTLHDEFKDNPRFSLHTARKGTYHLQISDLHLSDSGTYYCVTVNQYIPMFAEGAFLSVKGSASNVRSIVQQPVSESVQPGDSVTLNCTVHTEICDGEHSVYWFRSSGESQPGVIYTQGGRNGSCERSFDEESSAQSCIYHLLKRNLSLSDTATYYCAVASCGEILYGNGTRLGVGEDDCHNQMRILVFLSIARTGVVLCSLLTLTIIYMTRR